MVLYNNLMPEIHGKKILNQKLNKDSLNILLVGEPGVGKSLLINGLINYFQYKDFNDALISGVKTAVPYSMVFTDENYETHNINCQEIDDDIKTISLDNNFMKTTFNVNQEGKSVDVCIIECVPEENPEDEEDYNVPRLVDFLEKENTIHVVCLLIKASQTKSTISFRYMFNSIVNHNLFPIDRIIFCTTFSRHNNNRISEHVNELLLNLMPDLQLIRSKTIFSIDNEGLRFLYAKKHGMEVDTKEMEVYRKSWNTSSEEARTMMRRMIELKDSMNLTDINDKCQQNLCNGTYMAECIHGLLSAIAATHFQKYDYTQETAVIQIKVKLECAIKSIMDYCIAYRLYCQASGINEADEHIQYICHQIDQRNDLKCSPWDQILQEKLRTYYQDYSKTFQEKFMAEQTKSYWEQQCQLIKIPLFKNKFACELIRPRK